jgi:hypothetical protein
METLQSIRDSGERASSCLLVALIQYAEFVAQQNTQDAVETLSRIDTCITKIAQLIARGDLDLDTKMLKYYLFRVSAFSTRLKEALESRQSGGLAFALAEISLYLSIIHLDGRGIEAPNFTHEEVTIMSQSVHFILSRVYPSLIGLSSPADMEFLRANFWDDGRDLDILHELLDKLQVVVKT